MKHVILGNGPAGVIAAETLRKNAPADEIVLIGDELDMPYSRMSIPNLISGEISETGMHLRRDKDYFSRLHITQRFGRAAHISSRTRTVKMEDGSVEDFDKLLIATGSRPRVPPIPGIEFPGVHACWTLDDARQIVQLARPRSRVVLIGAGFIGCLMMEALASRGVDLTVVEKRDRMMAGALSKGAGDIVQRWCEKKGVKVRISTRVVAIGSNSLQQIGSPRIVRLSNGVQLQADLVVYCTGSTPNIDFLRGSGIKFVQGVMVDASMQTNIPGIYAAGDCAETFDEASGHNIIAGVQPNAADQAYCAALNMSDKHAFQRGVRHIDVFDTMGLVSLSFGHWQGIRGGQWVEVADDAHFRYMRLEFSRDILIGCNVVGNTEHANILRGLIQHQVRLGEWKDRLLQDPTLLKQAYAECAQQQFVDQASTFHTPYGSPPEPVSQSV
ncbi:NAD(P)/FAD-dependent oxidoreductase [Noviherbaspirillum saxi]|uniref:NAD(P)/FAD-dependent oxidoreductase n=1 Tax=Noviherbaspirillum saxi TaxID=2320863 RepID=A0A3A3FUE7_9BURK|nr:FAD-dependent oxidoreductase [Noviherbaspirillum saxi]RJF98158.1 NAD(P)/FAD-dependent oxidoreductase [Noviherbaspirillum saxi]